MKFSELNLSIKDEIKTVRIGDNVIEVKQYLPLEKKIDIISLAIQQSLGGTIQNTMAFESYLDLFIIMNYTNIDFSEYEDYGVLYDILESNDIINFILSAIPQIEYNSIKEHAFDMSAKYERYSNSLGKVISNLIDFSKAISENIEEVTQDEEKMQSLKFNTKINEIEELIQIALSNNYKVISIK